MPRRGCSGGAGRLQDLRDGFDSIRGAARTPAGTWVPSTTGAAPSPPPPPRGGGRGTTQPTTQPAMTRHARFLSAPLAQSLCTPRQADPGFQAKLLAHRAGVHALKTWSVE